MGFKLKNLGRHLAGGVITFAHGVVDHLGNSIVAPPAPILVGTAAVLAGAAVVKHLQKKNRNKPRTPATDEDVSCPGPVPSPVSSPASVVNSPRSPAPASPVAFKPQIAPFRIRGPAPLTRPTAANGQMTVFPSGDASPGTSLAALPEEHDITFATPAKAADDMALEYDHLLDDSEETAALRGQHKTSEILSSWNNRLQDSSSSPSVPKVRVPPLCLDKLADKAMQTRQASAQLSRPHKLEHLAIEEKENNVRVC